MTRVYPTGDGTALKALPQAANDGKSAHAIKCRACLSRLCPVEFAPNLSLHPAWRAS